MEKTPGRRRVRASADPAKEAVEVAARMVRRAGRLAGQGDPEHLAQLLELHRLLDEVVQEAVDTQRAGGITWQSIGDATGTTRQAALMKWAPKKTA